MKRVFVFTFVYIWRIKTGRIGRAEQAKAVTVLS